MIGVTGATGGVGSRVVQHLHGRVNEVVALARRPDAVPVAPGLTSRFANYDDPASLRAAFAGLHALVFVSSDGFAEPMRRHHEHVVAAAVGAGVEHAVYTSIVDVSPDSGFYYAPIHRETEALLADSGLEHCFARTSIFTDYFVSTWLCAGPRRRRPRAPGRRRSACRWSRGTTPPARWPPLPSHAAREWSS